MAKETEFDRIRKSSGRDATDAQPAAAPKQVKPAKASGGASAPATDGGDKK